MDIKKTPGCKILEDEFDAKKNFPDCCPKYDCEEGIEIIYENKNPKEPAAIQKNPGKRFHCFRLTQLGCLNYNVLSISGETEANEGEKTESDWMS